VSAASPHGRVAVVTGAASGIGRAVAGRFAAGGASVVGIDVDAAGLATLVDELGRAGGRAAAYTCDVADPVAVATTIDGVVQQHGGIDVLFNGVGVSGRRWGDGPVDRCSLEAWQRVLELNLTSMFLVCRHAMPSICARRGAVINLASVLGIVGGDEDFATHAYAASKGGIIALSRAMASYYAPQGVRVNVIAPGLIATPMSARAQQNPQIVARLATLQPLTGTFGQPDDVAAAAWYLASDDARFVTGIVLPVDGGWTVR